MSSGQQVTEPEETVRLGLAGIAVSAAPERVLDVVFDGRRVWSFRADQAGTPRAAETGEGPEWWVPWPRQLAQHLQGVAEVLVRDQEGTVLAAEELHFGSSDERVRIEDRMGRPLIMDSKGRLSLPFEGNEDATGALLGAAHAVLGALEDAGLEGFLAYGTLLGAVRGGAFIGHDNDVDLGYVSSRTQPVDVVRESIRLERRLVRAGMEVERYSGAGVKVFVYDDSGIRRGLDVFGGFWDGDHLAFLGEIYAPFRREWLLPRSTVTLEGEEFPAPAEPERLLELMYGPGWRVPDPTFAFEPGTAARERLTRWFRGIREHRNQWDAWYHAAKLQRPFLKPHHVARLLHRAEPAGCTVIDVGCGRGQDMAFLASERHPTIGFDYSLYATDYHLERAALHGWPLRAELLNFLELRQVLGWGARLAREIEGPRAVLARHFVNATSRRGREGLFRFSSMVLRGGGRLYLEFFDSEDPREAEPDDLLWEVDHRDIVEDAVALGGTIEETTFFDPNWFELPWHSADWDPKPRGCRMTITWA